MIRYFTAPFNDSGQPEIYLNAYLVEYSKRGYEAVEVKQVKKSFFMFGDNVWKITFEKLKGDR